MNDVDGARIRSRRNVDDLNISAIWQLPDNDAFVVSDHLRKRRPSPIDDPLGFLRMHAVLANVVDIDVVPDEFHA